MLTVVILCGGNGSRLWPLSNNNLPKQFLDLDNSGKTIYQMTCLRANLLNPSMFMIICNEKHVKLAEQQFLNLELDCKYIVVVEPFRKNTGPAITCAAILSETYDDNDNNNILVMPSDHIFNDDVFSLCVHKGLQLVDKGIVTFGINPSYPETGYGYIEYCDNELIKFVEKPNKNVAEKYLADGNYLWNSGVFLFNNKLMIDEIQKYSPDMLNTCRDTLMVSEIINNKLMLCGQRFTKVQDISIDYAIMEHHVDGKVVKYDGYWSDIGSFESLHKHLLKDSNNNYVSDNKNIKTMDTTNCFIKSNDLSVTTLGLDNLIIVNHNNVLMIADKNKSQHIKKIIIDIPKKIQNKFDRPWGNYQNIDGDDYSGYKVKKISVLPGKKLSLQYHHKRSEHWTIIAGKAQVQIGEDQLILHKNQSAFIPLNVLHRIENIGTELLVFIETQVGNYLGEDDIVRIEDDFGRV
jgi:mannose-1-phosphate guanylyltransferase/mannose-6-phosphate isomerase